VFDVLTAIVEKLKQELEFDRVIEVRLATSKKERRRRPPHAADAIDLLELISF
jgi:hypothetical protein